MTAVTSAPRPPLHGTVVAGLISAVVATGAMLAVGLALDQPTLAETVADRIARLTPLATIEAMIDAFGENAKHLLLGGVLLGQVAVGIGVACAHARTRWPASRNAAAILVLLGVVALVALPLLGAGALGVRSSAGAAGTLVSLAVAALLFVTVYAAMLRVLNPGGPLGAERAASRRALLRNGLIMAAGLSLGGAAFRWVTERPAPAQPATAGVPPRLSMGALAAVPANVEEMAETAELVSDAAPTTADLIAAIGEGIPGLSREVTPNDTFYAVSKNVLRDPTVNEGRWRLEVSGLVERPFSLTYDQMKALPAANQYFTLQCIGNAVGGDLIGNAEWRGISLAALLQGAGLKPGAVDVVLRAADDYADSIPIEKALDPDTMLAFEMNGEVLPKAHGFPLRLLAPDIYGMKQVKWITKVEVVDYDFKGLWQEQGWSDVATLNTGSRIDLPKNGAKLEPGSSLIGGVALAGMRGVQRVEVSTDGGGTWEEAAMKPQLGPNAWAVWLYHWRVPAGAGEAKILVRATDGTGAVQTADVHEDLPSGATGYHTITARSAEA
jgi:DMSO/TMAO reductase YedYZ molybdopterin-dependent catalytic subunit